MERVMGRNIEVRRMSGRIWRSRVIRKVLGKLGV